MIIKPCKISGIEGIFPIIEGGKGINVTNGITAGNFAKNGVVGTFSGTNADFFDSDGNLVKYDFSDLKTRKARHDKLIQYSIQGAIEQAKIAHDISGGNGAINMNVLWEAAETKNILEGVLPKTKGLISGVVSGAGLPYAMAKIASENSVYYYPIVSSGRALQILWKREYHKYPEFMGGVVYEDPWKAGGHNGISNNDHPDIPVNVYAKVLEIRQVLNSLKLSHVPVIVAGGVWRLDEWKDFIDNQELGSVFFQFGTRPLLTQESPVSEEYKKKLIGLSEDDVISNNFSPTGFFSMAVKNEFMNNLIEREKRQIEVSRSISEEFSESISTGVRGRELYVKSQDFDKAQTWLSQGFTKVIRTARKTGVFLTPEEATKIVKDQQDCVGCLSACRFSSWYLEGENHSTGELPDPTSFCIQKTLRDIGHGGSPETNLMFSGKIAYRFKTDEFYKNGFVPTIKELVERIKTGQ